MNIPKYSVFFDLLAKRHCVLRWSCKAHCSAWAFHTPPQSPFTSVQALFTLEGYLFVCFFLLFFFWWTREGSGLVWNIYRVHSSSSRTNTPAQKRQHSYGVSACGAQLQLRGNLDWVTCPWLEVWNIIHRISCISWHNVLTTPPLVFVQMTHYLKLH